jgi:hypothetical protein
MVAAEMKPSAPVSASFTKSPALVTPEICPSNEAPIPVGEVVGDEAVDGLPLCRHGASLRA